MSTIEDTLNEIRSDLMVLPSVRMYEGARAARRMARCRGILMGGRS